MNLDHKDLRSNSFSIYSWKKNKAKMVLPLNYSTVTRSILFSWWKPEILPF